MLSLLFSQLTTHQQSSWVLLIYRKFQLKKFKVKTLFKKEFPGKSKNNPEYKNKDAKEKPRLQTLELVSRPHLLLIVR